MKCPECQTDKWSDKWAHLDEITCENGHRFIGPGLLVSGSSSGPIKP